MSNIISFRELRETAWGHLQKERETLIPATLPYILASALAQTVALLFYVVFVITPVMHSGDAGQFSLQGDLGTLYSILKSIEAVVTFFVSLAVMLVCWNSLSGAQLQHGYLFRSAASLLPSFAWISLIATITIGAGFVLFIVPGIAFSVWYLFAQHTLVVDGKRGRDALSYSHTLVRGIFWPTAYRLSGIAVCTMLLSLAALACTLVGARLLFLFASFIAPSTASAIILGAVSIFVFFVLYGYVLLFATLMGLILYRNLRERHAKEKRETLQGT